MTAGLALGLGAYFAVADTDDVRSLGDTTQLPVVSQMGPESRLSIPGKKDRRERALQRRRSQPNGTRCAVYVVRGWYARTMNESPPEIVVVSSKIDPQELARLTSAFFEDMVKYVVDLGRGVVAVGGELHADAEEILLTEGSRQNDLWGANYYPGRGADDCIEYTSLINIRPAQGNRSMLVQDIDLRRQIRELTFSLIGEGEPLS